MKNYYCYCGNKLYNANEGDTLYCEEDCTTIFLSEKDKERIVNVWIDNFIIDDNLCRMTLNNYENNPFVRLEKQINNKWELVCYINQTMPIPFTDDGCQISLEKSIALFNSLLKLKAFH